MLDIDLVKDIDITERGSGWFIAQDFIPSSYYEAKDEIYDNIETINIEHFEDSALSLEDAEKEMIKKSLERHNGKRKKCAEELKISERTLYRKIKEYNLE